jgi:sterol 3beta-glucosyltransferase
MRVGMQTWGSEGDVRPLAALAETLAQRGHTVELVATGLGHIEPQKSVPGRTIRMVPEHSPVDLAEFTRQLGPDPSQTRVMKAILQDLLIPTLPAMEDAARDLASRCDVLVGHFLAHPLHAAARAADKPFVSLCYAPVIVPTRTTAPAAFPNLGRWLNPSLWKLEDFVLERLLGPTCRATFARLGAPPIATVRQAWLSSRCNLMAVSPTLCPRPHDWPAQHHITGEFIRPDQPQPVPAEIADFLADGAPPVYFGVGSPQQSDPTGHTDRLHQAARIWGGRAIVRTLDPAILPGSRSANGNILFAGPCDHRALFPHCAAVVHHGGAGTTHAIARAGVPAVTLSFIPEQRSWGKALAQAGSAKPPLRFRSATPAAIATRIQHTITPAHAHAAKALATRMHGEDGLMQATRIIESQLHTVGR